MPPQTAEDTETPAAPNLDTAKLQLAVEVALAVSARHGKPLSAAQIAREAGLSIPAMSNFRKHGIGGWVVQARLLRWLDMKWSLFEPATPANRPARRTEAA